MLSEKVDPSPPDFVVGEVDPPHFRQIRDDEIGQVRGDLIVRKIDLLEYFYLFYDFRDGLD
jgi:hypothetical protein